MASTITAQRIIEKVAARLATIKVTNGFYTDSGTEVSEWRTTPFHDNELGKALTFRDDGDEPFDHIAKGNSALQDRWLTVIISAPFRGGSATAGEKIRKVIADVYKAIGATTDGHLGETWSGIAIATSDEGAKPFVDQEERQVLSVDITIKIWYRTEKWKESET
jgi:hypothetical protein